MKVTFTRRVTAIAGIVAVFAIIATAAFAATLSQSASSLPSANPTDLKASNGKSWTKQLAPKDYIGLTAASTTTWGNATTTGGGNLTISKMTTSNYTGYVTITIKVTKKGVVLTNAMVTASGGNAGSTQIATTTLSKDNSTYTIKLRMPGEEGTPPLLTIKWYTTQLVL